MALIRKTWYSNIFPYPTFRRFLFDQIITWISFLAYYGIISIAITTVLCIISYFCGTFLPDEAFRMKSGEINRATFLTICLGYTVIGVALILLAMLGGFVWWLVASEYPAWVKYEHQKYGKYDHELLPNVKYEVSRWREIIDYVYDPGSVSKYLSRLAFYAGSFLLWMHVSVLMPRFYWPESTDVFPYLALAYISMCIQGLIVLIVVGIGYYLYTEWNNYLVFYERKTV